MAHPTTLRMPPDLEQQYDDLAAATGRTRSFLMMEALRRYAETEGWQITQVRRTLDRVERGEESFIPGPEALADFLARGWLTQESLDEARAFYDRPRHAPPPARPASDG